jgi:acyl carrier protein phosphodiesterase
VNNLTKVKSEFYKSGMGVGYLCSVNYLAHLYLSGNDDGLVIGNYIGDEVKGTKWKDLDPYIARGVLMHRQIDFYTDSHEINHEVAKQIRPYFGKWAGVAIDLYWDHFLARSWKNHHDLELEDYSMKMYAFLKENKPSLLNRSRHMLQYMSQHDWLTNYATHQGIGKAFNGLSRRIGSKNTLHRGAEILSSEYDFLDRHFELFFPDIKQVSGEWKNLRKPL